MAMTTVSKVLRKILPLRSCGAVIVAAGTASRMGGIDKVMAQLGGEPMILRTVRAFQENNVIQKIVIVTREDLVEPIRSLCRDFSKVTAVVVGGSNRQASVMAGLSAMPEEMAMVAIHDGARPLVSPEVIDRTVRAAHTYSAAAPGIPVKDTIKVTEGGVVRQTPDRSTLRAIQTPQVFDRALLMAALQKAQQDGVEVTDDCGAVERMGMSVKIVEGDEKNMKVTTPIDLHIAQFILEGKL